LQLIDIDVINFNEGNLRKAMRALERADCDHRLMNMESNTASILLNMYYEASSSMHCP
jgi:hypothetical protein